MRRQAALATLAGLISFGAVAHESAPGIMITGDGMEGMKPMRADGHAPIGVMGDHMHHKGEWMISYRFMSMHMDGNRIGNDDISPDEIVTSVPNRFAGMPGQPPTLRVVPTEMDMEMHMFGAMYGVTDSLTLMAMGMYVDKEMKHTTYMGGMGTTELGTFTTDSKGFGDTTLASLIRLFEGDMHKLHLNLGVGLPTGSITKRDSVLTPMGGRPTLRMPYPMQLGSGTFDAKPGITYNGRWGDITWGAQYMSDLPIGTNDEGYSLGDKHELTAWAAFQWVPWLSTSFRLDAMSQDDIDGIDDQIVAPVQTANPDNIGGERVDALFGFNLMGQSGVLRGHRVAVEFGVPIYQHLNGPQLETDYLVTVGYQKMLHF